MIPLWLVILVWCLDILIAVSLLLACFARSRMDKRSRNYNSDNASDNSATALKNLDSRYQPPSAPSYNPAGRPQPQVTGGYEPYPAPRPMVMAGQQSQWQQQPAVQHKIPPPRPLPPSILKQRPNDSWDTGPPSEVSTHTQHSSVSYVV